MPPPPSVLIPVNVTLFYQDEEAVLSELELHYITLFIYLHFTCFFFYLVWNNFQVASIFALEHIVYTQRYSIIGTHCKSAIFSCLVGNIWKVLTQECKF